MPEVPTLLTASEAAERLRTSPETVRRWARSGLLEAVVLPSGSIRFREADVARLFDTRPA